MKPLRLEPDGDRQRVVLLDDSVEAELKLRARRRSAPTSALVLLDDSVEAELKPESAPRGRVTLAEFSSTTASRPN